MIKFNQVTKQFSPDSYGAQDLSFEIEPGEFLILTGKSGAGKTTLMRLMIKEYTPDSGEIFFDDLDIGMMPYSHVHNLRRKIGVVFQDYRLLPELKVWENIALPLSIVNQSDREIEERVTDLLNLIKLPNKAELFPSQLSGGEAQRVSIARALAIGPNVIFADEPTGNLDSETSAGIGKLLRKINELGTTVIFATHDPAVLELFSSERHLHLEDGKLVKDTKSAKKSEKSPSKNSEEKSEKKDKGVEKNKSQKTEKDMESEVKDDAPDENDSEAKSGFLGRFLGKFAKDENENENEDNEPEAEVEDLDSESKKEKEDKKDDKSDKSSKKSSKKDK